MRSVCVVDNSTLVTLTSLHHLSIFNHLRSIFQTIHIPEGIKKEYESSTAVGYEPVRRLILERMKLNSGFLAICNRYNLTSLNFLKTIKGIHHGEAEVAAQHESVNSNFVLSDDLNFIKGLKRADRNIKVIGTLHLIAWLDCMKLIEPKTYLQRIYTQGPFKSHQLRAAYMEMIAHFGISMSKKELGRKTSLKVLGIN